MAINRSVFPGMFTMGNAVCGFLSILSAFEGNLVAASWFIILAGFLDALDGKVARLSNTTSQFGVELDSLADFLSFGVSPAVLIYTANLNDLGKWGWILPIVYIMAAQYRLARYNVLADSDEKKDFHGLPVPVPAMAIVTFVIMSHHLWGGMRYDEVVVAMILLFSFLMVSQVPYDMIPDRVRSKGDRLRFILLFAAGVFIGASLIVNGTYFNFRVLLFPLVGLYILFGIVREFFRLTTVGVSKVAKRSHHRRETDNFKEDSDG